MSGRAFLVFLVYLVLPQAHGVGSRPARLGTYLVNLVYLVPGGPVVSYLEKDGIPADRLTPHGYGKTNFVASNSTREGRAQNRRVELVPVQ